eukprot:2548598-Pyramimonas_sp.AAC.1
MTGVLITLFVIQCALQVRVSTELLAVVTTALVLEGWSSHLDPELRILNVLKDLLDTAEKIQGRIVQRLWRLATRISHDNIDT